MALTPLESGTVEIGGDTGTSHPSKTYYLDFDNGIISNKMIEGEDALRQFIQKAIRTARFHFMIYSTEYGCELEELIGHDVSLELLKQEIPRVIKESLVYDDRIKDVTNFEIVKEKGNLYITFTVTTVDGVELIEEVSV
jgi:phage baseplate assembly protein W